MRTLLVGCSGGIGTAIAHRLKEKGHTLIGIDRTDQCDAGIVSRFYQADLNQTGQVVTACTNVIKEIPNLWAIVYNSGICPMVDFEKYTTPLWDEVQNINVRAAFIICQRLGTLIEEGGRIVTIASAAAYGGHDIAYAASKAALLGLTKSLAINLSQRKILVNAVCPGPTETPINAPLSPRRVKEFNKRVLLHRFGKPQEIAVVVDFLLSPENSFMTGATIDINGGLYLR